VLTCAHKTTFALGQFTKQGRQAAVKFFPIVPLVILLSSTLSSGTVGQAIRIKPVAQTQRQAVKVMSSDSKQQQSTFEVEFTNRLFSDL